MRVLVPNPSFMGQTLSDDERTQFLTWYEEEERKIFHNQEELLTYCMDDGTVLRKACCPLRTLFLFGQNSPFIEDLLSLPWM
jgi:hypothetical protein